MTQSTHLRPRKSPTFNWADTPTRRKRSRPLDRKGLKEEALRKLREAQKAELPAGSKILKEELSYSFPDGMCILSAQCRCQEEIGEVREILVNQTETVEDF